MSHPNDETLLFYRFGTLEPEAMPSVADHLRTCNECAARYAKLGQGVDSLKAYDAEAYAEDAALDAAITVATSTVRARGPRPAPAAQPAPTPFAPAPSFDAPPPAEEPPPPKTTRPPPAWPGFAAWLGLREGAPMRLGRLALGGVVAILLGSAGAGQVYFSNLTLPLSTSVEAEATLVSGGQSLVRVNVNRRGDAVKDAAVEFALLTPSGRVTLGTTTTNAEGQGSATFTVPDLDVDQAQLETVATAGADRDVVTTKVLLSHEYRVHLSTDKPLYQPGQTIHLRSLAMRVPNTHPAAGKELVFEVHDARNTRIISHSVNISPLGVASYDLELSDDVALGRWTLSAKLGDVVAETKVDISRYTLPKFKLAVSPERESYLAGERLKAHVSAKYFFGKPVAKAKVKTYVLRGDGTVLTEKSYTTDADGTFELITELPATLARTGVPESVTVQLEAKDAAGQEERTERSITVARERLVVELFEDELAPGLESSYIVATSTPDGRPVSCKVTVTPPNAQPLEVQTSAFGLGRFTFTPNQAGTVNFALRAEDAEGHSVTSTRSVFTPYPRLVLSTDKALYRPGDTVTISARVAGSANHQFTAELRTAGSLLSTPTLTFVPDATKIAALAKATFTLPRDLKGLVTVRAGASSRSFLVTDPHALQLKLVSDKPAYKPGDEAKLRFEVTDAAGKPKVAALGVSIVDESLFALTADKPDQVRAYFLVTKALLAPKHGVSMGELITTTWTDDEQLAAKLLLAMTPEVAPIPQQNVSSATDKLAAMERDQEVFESRKARAIFVAALLVLLALLATGAARAPLFTSMLLATCAGVAASTELALVYVGGVTMLVSAACFWQRQRLTGELRWVFFVLPAGALLASFLSMQRLPSVDVDELKLGYAVPLIVAAVVVLWTSTRMPGSVTGVLIGVLALGAFVTLPPLIATCGVVVTIALALWLHTEGFTFDWRLVPAVMVVALVLFAMNLKTKLSSFPTDALSGNNTPVAVRLGAPTEKMKLEKRTAFDDSPGEIARGPAAEPFPAPRPAAKAIGRLQGAGGGLAGLSALLAPQRDSGRAANAAPEPPRREVHVRQHFPETMYVNPQLISDEKGVAEFTVPVADSITAWRLSALASSADGTLGSFNAPLKVFQSFFVDVDMPVALVRGDQASIPVAIYNYLETNQVVRLEVKQEPWFELVGAFDNKVSIAGGSVEGRWLRVKVLEPGTHTLTMRADGTDQSDVVVRELLVSEQGRQDAVTVSGTLTAGAAKKVALVIPEAAVGQLELLVKLMPSMTATALDGIEGTLQQPTGCFEQTSATTYPNVLVTEYLKRNNHLEAQVQATANRFISLGYQRLVGYEVEGGGFEWFGRAPANQILSAYGLMEFTDMARLYPVDPELIARTQRWLLRKQLGDGSWAVDPQMLADGLFRSEHRGRLTVTAYVTWALAESGFTGPALDRAQHYLQTNGDQATDAYTLSLMTAGFAKTKHEALEQARLALVSLAVREGPVVRFKAGSGTAYYGRGMSADVETTALAAYALGLTGSSAELVKGAHEFLLSQRLGHGAWPTTQATILSLKALLQGAEKGGGAKVTVAANGAAPETYTLDGPRTKVVVLTQHVKKGTNVLELSTDHDAPFIATATFTTPWRSKGDDDKAPLALSVDYGAKKVDVGDIVPVNVKVTYRGTDASGMAMVELGVPAGLSAIPDDLEALKRTSGVGKYQVGAGKLRLYFDRLAPGAVLAFGLRFKAVNPVDTRGVGSNAYLYYDPAVKAVAPPVAIAIR